MQALRGLLVVSLEQAVAAPYVSGRLARMGARVIKIERPEGDFARGYDQVVRGQSAYYVWLNAGKESLVLDIKQASDAQRLHDLIAQADVFIQNLAPGAASRAGFDSLALRRRHRRLITCDISGYGEQGAYASRKAYDLLVQAETGLASITGSPEAPGRSGVSVCDIGAGMHALEGILEALYARTQTGVGIGIKVSLFDGMADWMNVPLLHQEYGGKAPARVGLGHPTIAPYGLFVTVDGVTLLVSIQNSREWPPFCRDVLDDASLVDHEAFATNDLRVKHRAALDAHVQERIGHLSRDECCRRLDAAGIAYGLLNDVAGLAAHPQLRRREVDSPAGRLSLAASAVRFEDDEGVMLGEPVLRLRDLGDHDALPQPLPEFLA
jgi:crotonobetainyl-CoA:carnitine CoA-transferase CaiB-like acyl-CoA transferase